MPRKNIKIREALVKEKDRKIKKPKTTLYEIINGVYLRKNRLDTVITVDIKNIVIGVTGINPRNFKIGDLYE